MKTKSIIEPLESRIAPASVLAYTDIDGDKVKITATIGDLAGHATFSGATDGQLQLLDLTDPTFNGASISFAVIKAGVGDGLAAVGRINGGTNNFGSIVVKGDLGVIDAGSNTAGIFGVKLLSVRSMGLYGLATQGGVGDLDSRILGEVGTFTVAGDVKNVMVRVVNNPDTAIGKLTIGGSLIGSGADTGYFFIIGGIGTAKIGRDVVGGFGQHAGSIFANGDVGSFIVGGSVIGGSASSTGTLSGFEVGSITIAGSLIGGSGTGAGSVGSNGSLDRVTIGGSLIGGSGNSAGSIGTNEAIGAITIRGDLVGGTDQRTGSIVSGGSVGSVTIGGSLVGGSGFTDTGAIRVFGDLGPVKIGRDLQGSSGAESGKIESFGKLTSVTIGGSVIGGSGNMNTFTDGAFVVHAGQIFAVGDMGPVKIKGGVIGGGGVSTGTIRANGKLASISIGGALVGTSANDTGGVFSGDEMGAVKIGGDLRGGSITGTASLTGSGEIFSNRNVTSITIGGSIVSGIDGSSGALLKNAAIGALGTIGSVKVKGGLIGHSTATGDSPVIISAQGLVGASTVVLGKISIGGRVEHALLLGGYFHGVDPANPGNFATNGNAQIGAITVGGDWFASSAVAGVKDTDNDGFGDDDDAVVANIGASIARIASITIKGVVAGIAGKQFGFVAEEIGAFKAGGFTATLNATPLPKDVIELSPITQGVTIREV